MLDKTKTAAPKIVNGINVDDLFVLIDGVPGPPCLLISI